MSKATEVLANSAAHSMDVAASAANGVANSKTASSLDNALATMINSSVQATGDAIAWAKGQIPDVINQLLMWKAVESFIYFFSLMVLALLLAVLSKKLFKWVKEAKEESQSLSLFDDVDVFLTAVGCISVCASVGFVFIALNNHDWLQIWIAPKLYLIEYAANLVKG